MIPASVVLDAIDQRILTELARDGRISNADLARRVGLTASPCWTRVRALEQQGVIKGYTVIVDYAALGLPDMFIVEVTLDKHRHGGVGSIEPSNGVGAVDGFIKAIEGMPEIIDAALVAGDCDFYLRVAMGSAADYEKFLREKLYRIPNVKFARSILIIRRIMREHSPGL